MSLKQIYWTIGPYDIAAIAEAPHDQSVSAFLLELGSAENHRITTLGAYNREEMSSILERLD